MGSVLKRAVAPFGERFKAIAGQAQELRPVDLQMERGNHRVIDNALR